MSSNMACWKIPDKWTCEKCIVGKIIEVNGEFSSKPRLMTPEGKFKSLSSCEEWSPYSYGPLQVISQLYNLMYRIITTFITIEIRGKSVNIRIIMHYKSHSTHMSQLVKGHNSIFQWSFLRSFEVDIGCRHDFIAPRLCTVRPLLSWG